MPQLRFFNLLTMSVCARGRCSVPAKTASMIKSVLRGKPFLVTEDPESYADICVLRVHNVTELNKVPLYEFIALLILMPAGLAPPAEWEDYDTLYVCAEPNFARAEAFKAFLFASGFYRDILEEEIEV